MSASELNVKVPYRFPGTPPVLWASVIPAPSFTRCAPSPESQDSSSFISIFLDSDLRGEVVSSKRQRRDPRRLHTWRLRRWNHDASTRSGKECSDSVTPLRAAHARIVHPRTEVRGE